MLSTQMTLAQAFFSVADERPRQEALVCGEQRVTYGELAGRVRALAAGLASFGLHKGDVIAMQLSPGPEYVCTFFAAAQLGLVVVPLNTQLRARTLSEVLVDCTPAAMVAESAPEAGVLEQVAGFRHLILAGESQDRAHWLEEVIAIGRGLPEPSVDVRPEDLMALLYTSGTTGAPKGTMHSHRSLIAPVVASLKIRELWMRNPSLKMVGETAKVLARYRTRLLRVIGKPQTFLSTAPWHTITGLEVMFQGMLMGDRMVVMRRFHPREALELIEREKVTILVAVPVAYQLMLALENFDRYDLSSLLICGTGAAPCPPELARQIRTRFGCAVHIGFGMTETAGGMAVPSIGDSDEHQIATVGKPLPGIEIKIVDEQRRELPRGQVGEIAFRGDSVMLGYYHAPEATAQVVDEEGWYYTGDLGMIDEQGYLRIVGRKKDMIIRAGQNVYPGEIEAYLDAHPKILESAVVGVPSALEGEAVWAFIRLKEGQTMTAGEVLEYCRAELEAYKIPAEVRFVDDFPRTENGKPQKYRLREEAIQEMEEGRNR